MCVFLANTHCNTWLVASLDWGLDRGLDQGLDRGLEQGLDLGLDWSLYLFCNLYSHPLVNMIFYNVISYNVKIFSEFSLQKTSITLFYTIKRITLYKISVTKKHLLSDFYNVSFG